ncbi:MAG: hypothetical protein LBQ61_07955, partial [Spirochaetales bacterium]|nr:hypothetical protein [Spirochaetales bacterium]
MVFPAKEFPLLYRRLRQIQNRIWTFRAPLEAEIRCSAEPETFAEAQGRAFVPIKPGTPWGKKLSCAWLKLRGEVPPGLENPAVLLNNTGEALIYNAQGSPLGALNRVWFPFATPQSGGAFRALDVPEPLGPRIELYADCSFNGILMFNLGRGRFGGAYIGERDSAAYDFYYDY